jgi:hypothetical protein
LDDGLLAGTDRLRRGLLVRWRLSPPALALVERDHLPTRRQLPRIELRRERACYIGESHPHGVENASLQLRIGRLGRGCKTRRAPDAASTRAIELTEGAESCSIVSEAFGVAGF